MNDANQRKDQQHELPPGVETYLECMTRSMLAGLAGACLGFSGFHFAQKLLQSKLPYPSRFNGFISSAAALVTTYEVTVIRGQVCKDAFEAAENNYIALSET